MPSVTDALRQHAPAQRQVDRRPEGLRDLCPSSGAGVVEEVGCRHPAGGRRPGGTEILGALRLSSGDQRQPDLGLRRILGDLLLYANGNPGPQDASR